MFSIEHSRTKVKAYTFGAYLAPNRGARSVAHTLETFLKHNQPSSKHTNTPSDTL